MARILVPQTRWYDLLSTVGYYGETVFEKAIKQHLHTLFPSHHVIPFKMDVSSTSRRRPVVKRPDLLMVQKDLSSWTVIEVEMSNHVLSHVLDQTKVFLDGDYNAPDLAAYASAQLRLHCGVSISETRISQMMGTLAPSVLVIVDSKKEQWRKALNKAGVEMCVLEIYKSTPGAYAYRIHGQYPIVVQREVHCRHHSSLANTLEVIGSFAFEPFADPSNPEVMAIFLEEQTRWGVFYDAGNAFLRFLGQLNPLMAPDTYRFFIDQHNCYHLQKN